MTALEIVVVAGIWSIGIVGAVLWFRRLQAKARQVQSIREIDGQLVLLADYVSYPTRSRGDTCPFGNLFLTRKQMIFDSKRDIVFGQFRVAFSLGRIKSIKRMRKQFLIINLNDGSTHEFQLTTTTAQQWINKIETRL